MSRKVTTRKVISVKEAILIGLILIGAFGLYFFMMGDSEEGAYARVTVRGYDDVYLNLTEDGIFPLAQNAQVQLRVYNGGISFFASDCPDQICVNIGQITRTGQTATCLPNLVSVSIIASGDDEFDIIAW